MGKADWPTASEVAAQMVSAGLVSSAPSDESIEPYLGAAIEEWERSTGFRPFKEGGSASYRYDPPGPDGILELRAGFTAITAVAAYLNDTDETGVALIVLTDYELWPYEARAEDRPYTEIRFRRSVGSRARSVKVTGTRGYDDEIPYEAWVAVLKDAGQKYLNASVSGSAGARVIKQGPVTIEYTDDGSVLTAWEQAIETVAHRYRRNVVT